jgi:antitoxin component of MazEF toxin-antitoxin module
VPFEVAREAGLSDGEPVEIETLDGDILIRRRAAHARARQEAERAAAEIVAESRDHSLRGLPLRELREEGRRG